MNYYETLCEPATLSNNGQSSATSGESMLVASNLAIYENSNGYMPFNASYQYMNHSTATATTTAESTTEPTTLPEDSEVVGSDWRIDKLSASASGNEYYPSQQSMVPMMTGGSQWDFSGTPIARQHRNSTNSNNNVYQRSSMPPYMSYNHHPSYTYYDVMGTTNNENVPYQQQQAEQHQQFSSASSNAVPNPTIQTASISEKSYTASNIPGKRPRGRPRKHPLPIPPQTTFRPPSYENSGGNSSSPQHHILDRSDDLRAQNDKAEHFMTTVQKFMVETTEKVANGMAALDRFYESYEEYVGFCGPFRRIALGLQFQEVEPLEDKTSTAESDVLDVLVNSCTSSRNDLMVNLNSSYIWNSLDPRVPVRDLVISRYHMAVLLNDCRVFVYRHKTHPQVTTKVDQWEHVAALDGKGTVAIRIASAKLPEDWRETAHAVKRRSLMKDFLGLEDDRHLSEQELKVLLTSTKEGALCKETVEYDWLPDPFVLVSLDSSGVVRTCKCFGFYGYPFLLKTGDNSFNVGRSELCIDKIERQVDITVPTKEIGPDGTPIKHKATIQDVVVGELTASSLIYESMTLEAPIIIYAVRGTEHSVFVKGRNLYVRFKNFPTGLAKVYCGPLGYTGALLLVNGVVWTWSSRKHPDSDKMVAEIVQAAGSLEGRTVIDLTGSGPTMYALSSDGIIHEWNGISSYEGTTEGKDYAPIPSIPVPIEYTPQYKLESLSKCNNEEVLSWRGDNNNHHNHLDDQNVRNSEIVSLYSDNIERIICMENYILTYSSKVGRFNFIKTLVDYTDKGTDINIVWKGLSDKEMKNVLSYLHEMGGRPLSSNPVCIARMKLPRNCPDDQLRKQLEIMAHSNPPAYRLIVSPNAIIVGRLKQFDVIEEGKKLLGRRIPVALAACNTKLYLEAFTGLSLDLLDEKRLTDKILEFEDKKTNNSPIVGPSSGIQTRKRTRKLEGEAAPTVEDKVLDDKRRKRNEEMSNTC